MAQIQVLDSGTIDKIAAGEVVERPSSVVKELVENAVDAGADAVTVETKEGGIEFIRVTDNGSGIEPQQVRNAFLRHATSKIRSAEDLMSVSSLGFRGEALSSIAAVSKVEVITKIRENLTGVRYTLEGAAETGMEEVGAPEGTTILVRNLFFNTPVRRKFLKQPATEGSYIAELMEHMALSRPDVSFKLVMNGQVKFHTSGNGSLKEVVYRIYGRDVSSNLVEIASEWKGMEIQGYLGKPVLNRANRNFENYFINGRYIKSRLIARAIEEGYKEYLMQHKFPFTVLHFKTGAGMVDVNVHPTKMDVRFTDGIPFFDFVASSVSAALKVREMIPETFPDGAALQASDETVKKTAGTGEKETGAAPQYVEKPKNSMPEPFETRRAEQYKVMEEMKYEAEQPKMQDLMQNPVWNRIIGNENSAEVPKYETNHANIIKAKDQVIIERPAQMNLFEEKMLSADKREEYNILGQIFDTYWLVAFRDKLFIVDQHAAHEKVKYEALMRAYREKTSQSQLLNPPIVVTLTAKEEQVLKEHLEVFKGLGFEVEEFGGNEYALRGVPSDLYGCNEKEMFEAVLDELAQGVSGGQMSVVEEKIASMSCKAAVKGNNSLSLQEMEALLDQLLTLDNPYNCPHGRPTIISMSKYEIEKKFKRIV